VAGGGLSAAVIARSLCASTPWFLEVRLQARPGGWAAFVQIDPNLIRARAAQQGLEDIPLTVATRDPKLRQVWDGYVSLINRYLAPDEQIVALRPILDPWGDRPEAEPNPSRTRMGQLLSQR
jgi:hypothetical protein